LVASPVIAERYVNAIITYCETLKTYPLRGTPRDDLRPGLRITNYKGRTLIAFDVNAQQVSIIGLFYGGQDYETTLQIDIEDED
jgi:toxin ParE1/3/4